MRENQPSERSIDVPSVRIIFAGGGTGGHLFPALAIAEEIRAVAPSADILFVGTKKRIEADVVPKHGFRFATISISGFRRRLRPDTFLYPFKVILALMQARAILKKMNPHVVVGTGGYVSGPVLFMASLHGIPTLIQEQNSYPGVTTRLLGKMVSEVHLTFEESRSYLSRKDNLVVTGNPTRRSLEGVSPAEAAAYFGFSGSAKTILVVGGSLGAHSLNIAFVAHAAEILDLGYRIIWQTGPADLEMVRSRIAAGPGKLWIQPFIERMEYAYAASDLVICRAGATTLAELAVAGKPSILVPYPHATANHQMANARSVQAHGAAEVIEDGRLTEQLLPVLRSVMESGRLAAMAAASKVLARPEAASVIARRVLQLAGKV